MNVQSFHSIPVQYLSVRIFRQKALTDTYSDSGIFMLSRRSALQRLGVGAGIVLAGCSAIQGGNSSSPADKPETTSSSPESTSSCSHQELHVQETTKEALEEGEYGIVGYENLSARQQQTFNGALTGGASNVSDERGWYKVIEYKDDEHWLPLVVRYNETLYSIEVAHVDYVC